MQSIPNLEEFIKVYRFQQLREELGNDVDALLQEDEEDTKPKEALMSYLPTRKPRSGYTTQPDRTNILDIPEVSIETA